MGVTGLWQVLQPCARPTNIATLNKKRLAVDASIWIYQFLKAVRDKDGNALRSSHVVGFFRRICKLLWFGILPVFVFDGGAPALKRQTILGRKQRREGRREDASRTAGKLLAVQMQRYANEEIERQRKKRNQKKATEAAAADPREQPEDLPDFKDVVYVDELGMSQEERLRKRRKFVKQDPYHLPELDGAIGSQVNPEDPRIMSVEQLEEYAQQFGAGNDIDLYDFSNIDFDGDFFKSLPAADRYWILNAARLRSRLRMGLSKEQLEMMFPNRMDFSRFQIERAQERNNLTQRLMKELGMTGLDLTISGGGRIAGDQNREYILVKNDGAEGGWALGVVSKDRDLGRRHKPIDVDALTFEFQGTNDQPEEDDEDNFEDVPIEGLNRLPRSQALAAQASQQQKQALRIPEDDDDDTMFVGGPSSKEEEDLFNDLGQTADLDEQDDVQRAIEMSLQAQHETSGTVNAASDSDDVEFEDVTTEAPSWEQKAVDTAKILPKPAVKFNLNMINRRANAEVSNPITKPVVVHQPELANNSDSDSDSDMDLQAALALSRKAQHEKPSTAPAPAQMTSLTSGSNFGGSLPFPKLDWSFKKPSAPLPASTSKPIPKNDNEIFEFGGGFEIHTEASKSQDEKPANDLSPWMASDEDITEGLRKQQEAQIQMDAQDRAHALAQAETFKEFMSHAQNEQKIVVEIDSDSGDDIQIVDCPEAHASTSEKEEADKVCSPVRSDISWSVTPELVGQSPEPEFEDITLPDASTEQTLAEMKDGEESPQPEFEDVVTATESLTYALAPATTVSEEPPHEFEIDDDELFGSSASESEKEEDDGLREIEDEQLVVQMVEEAEEHARFSNELHNRPTDTAHDSIEAELSQLRNQQRKDRRDADEVTENMALECQALLRLFGIPFITAPMEAEAQCAELVRLGLVDGVITDDSDTFLFGGTRVYKNMFNTSKFVECYIAEDLEREMSLDRNGLISLAQLLGSDYTEGLPGVGPVTAVEILSEFPGRDGLKNFKEWWEDVQMNNRPREADAASPFRKKFRHTQGTKLFLPTGFPSPTVYDAYMRPNVDSSKESFQWGVPDLDGLRRFLMSTIGWGQDRTDEVLVPVIKDMNRREREGTQSNITKYFQGGMGVGARDAFAPRQRIQRSSKRMAQAVNKLRKATLTDGLGVESTEEEAVEPIASKGSKRKRGKEKGEVDKVDVDVDADGEYEGENSNGGDDRDDDYQTGTQKKKKKNIRQRA